MRISKKLSIWLAILLLPLALTLVDCSGNDRQCTKSTDCASGWYCSFGGCFKRPTNESNPPIATTPTSPDATNGDAK